MVAVNHLLVTPKKKSGFFEGLLGDLPSFCEHDWGLDEEMTAMTFESRSYKLSEDPRSEWQSNGLRSFYVAIDESSSLTCSGNIELMQYSGLLIEQTSGFSCSSEDKDYLSQENLAAIIQELDDLAKCSSSKLDENISTLDDSPSGSFTKIYRTDVDIENDWKVFSLRFHKKLCELAYALDDSGIEYLIASPGGGLQGGYEDGNNNIGPFTYAKAFRSSESYIYVSESGCGIAA